MVWFGGLSLCNWLHLGRSWLDRFGGFHRFGELPMFGTRLLFALNMPLCFWLVPSFCNWQHRFGRLPRFGRLSRLGRLHWFVLVRGKRLQLRLSGGGLLPCNWQPRFRRLPHFGRQLRFGGTMPILKPTHGIGI